MMLSRDVLLSPPPPPISIDVPELGGEVFMRVLSGLEYMAMMDRVRAEEMGERESSAMLLELSLCDEDGKRVLDDGDGLRLAEGHGPAYARLLMKAQEVNGLGN